VGLPVDGYCGLCNVAQRVLLYQWFICQICLNVILSYTKSFAASKTLREFWQQSILPLQPKSRLEETEVVALEPFVPGKRNKDKAVKTLDFSVYDDSLKTHGPIFFIEMKAGPGSIDEMKQFQLDINDSNDIATVCNREGIPAYVFHVQVGEEYYPPTRRAVGKAIWWTDAFTLEHNLLYVKRRRGEDKDAGYYSPKAFKGVEGFLNELKSNRYSLLKQKLAKTPLLQR
jgi:hypothetical protein